MDLAGTAETVEDLVETAGVSDPFDFLPSYIYHGYKSLGGDFGGGGGDFGGGGGDFGGGGF